LLISRAVLNHAPALEHNSFRALRSRRFAIMIAHQFEHIVEDICGYSMVDFRHQMLAL